MKENISYDEKINKYIMEMSMHNLLSILQDKLDYCSTYV